MNSSTHHLRITCRICASERVHQFLSLGPTPLANSFLSSPEEFASEQSYPLDVYFCEDCTLVQLMDVINPEVLFRDYIYVTGTSDTIAVHNQAYASTVVDLLKLGRSDLVVEVASNDGSLLKCFQQHQVSTLGVEPATNISALAQKNGIETVNRFFNQSVAQEIKDQFGPAKAVIGNNVLAHVDDTVDFLAGFRYLLSADGLAILEVPYLGELLAHLEYDTIYHEHLCYFSVQALKRLCDEAGMSLVRIDRVPIHGGSIRIYAGKSAVYGTHAAAVLEMIEQERELGMHNLERYLSFAAQVEDSRTAILELLESMLQSGRSVAGYAAPAKGNTLLNFCGIDTDLLPYTVDKNRWKVGKFTPGRHIPVLPVETLLERQPDYVFILAWNFAAEIMRQQTEYARRGGKFIIPIPELRVM